MGCDIHIYSESNIDGKWVNNEEFIKEWDNDPPSVPYEKQFYNGRNYELFGALAGVRRPDLQLFDAKGFPPDASELVKSQYESWGCDAHTPSYLTLYELKMLDTSTLYIPVSGMMCKTQFDRLWSSISSGEPDWNLLYPYCQWTNRPGVVRFKFKVPFDFITHGILKDWVSTLDDMPGEEKRLVFWFDN